MLKVAFVCVVLPTFILLASTENIQIQALQETVIYKENDLVITCSIINPSELSSISFIQLQKNYSTTFDTIVSVGIGQTPTVQWKDSALQGRASATGSIDSPSTAQLRFTIDKSYVQCSDFKTYKCKMSGFSTASGGVTQETSPITISYIANPTVIEMPIVKFLNEPINTPCRSFPLGAVIQFTCEGFVGSDPHNTIRWCSKNSYENSFTELASINTDAKFFDCQYTRSSKIIYNFTRDDRFTQFLCESGYSGTCRTGTAIQYVNITFATPTKIMSPTVRVLKKLNDTSDRRFPVATAITLSCNGEVGSDPKSTIRWCVQKANQNNYTELSLTPVHSEASPSGCQYTRSSTITYNLTSQDTFTKFLCESGYTGFCGTGTAIQYLNISTDVPAKTTKDESAKKTEDYSIDRHIGWIVGVLFSCISIIPVIIYMIYIWQKNPGCNENPQNPSTNPPETPSGGWENQRHPEVGTKGTKETPIDPEQIILEKINEANIDEGNLHEKTNKKVNDTNRYDNKALEGGQTTETQKGSEESVDQSNLHSNVLGDEPVYVTM